MTWHDAAALSTVWLVLSGTAAVHAQAIQSTAGTDRAGETWTPPKTSFGHPDLQGVWAHDILAPFERPNESGDKAAMTDAEIARVRARAETLRDGGNAIFVDGLFQRAARDTVPDQAANPANTGTFNQVPPSDLFLENRTSMIVNPADGPIAPLMPEAQARAGMLGRSMSTPPSGPEDRSLFERCITSGVPWVLTGYNSVYQILQTPDHVVLLMENIHDARIVPLDGRRHVSSRIGQWLGDSRGRWEGNTLAIETTNFSPKSANILIGGAADGLTLTERFTRTDAETLKNEWTVNDPKTFTRPWTAVAPLRKIDAKVYEYACHDENYGMVGKLAGARAQERANAGVSSAK